jgi:hypothetical protein
MWKEKSVRNFLIIMLVIIILFFASLSYVPSFGRLFVHSEAPSVGTRSLPNGTLAQVITTNPNGSPAVTLSTNWAGIEDYVPYLIFWRQAITEVDSTITISTISMPPSSQVCSQVDQVMCSWIGISNGAGGTGGLAQTGYTRDATGNSQYYLFYEVYPYNSMQEVWNGGEVAAVSPGQTVHFYIQQSGSTWDFTADVSNGNQYTTEVTYSFTGYYVQSMTEAYSANGIIQQIAEFSNVYFESGVFTSGGTQYSIPSWGNYNVYRMDQQSNVQNPSDVISYFSGNNIYTEWYNSYYSYSYVNG